MNHFEVTTYKDIITNDLLSTAIPWYNRLMLRLKVKEVAKEKGFSQGKLARAADMATNTLRAIYRDPYREVSTITINKLAKALEVPVTYLIEDVSEAFALQEKAELAKDAP